jgi:prenyltransferase beta subunit
VRRSIGDGENGRRRSFIFVAAVLSVVLCLNSLLFFSPALSPSCQASKQVVQRSPGIPYVTTRRNATIEFLSVLQMPSGAFVAYLNQPSYGANQVDAQRDVSALSTIGGLHAVSVEAIINYSVNCQAAVGGFVYKPENVPKGYVPELVSTTVVVELLKELSALNRIHNVPKLLDWVVSCYNSATGGFSNQPSYAEDVWATSDGLVVLSAFGALNRIDVAKTLHHLVTDYYQDDGGFSLGPSKGEATGEITTRPALQALACISGLGSIPNRTKTINYILSTCGYNASLGTFVQPSGGTGITASVGAIVMLGLLGATGIINGNTTVDAVLACQSSLNGGFKPFVSDDNSRLNGGSGYDAVQILQALNALSRLDENITLSEHPQWVGGNGPPPEPPNPNGFSLSPFEEALGICLLAVIVLTPIVVRSSRNSANKRRRIVRTFG